MRGGKSDAGGPEKQLILFVWPYGIQKIVTFRIEYPSDYSLNFNKASRANKVPFAGGVMVFLGGTMI